MRCGRLFVSAGAGRKFPLAPRVLIAETDPALRQRLHGRLLDQDIVSDCVVSAPEALEKLNETSYALVVADVGLPAGIEHVISRISRVERSRRPIVLILAPTAEAARGLDVEIVQIVLRRPVQVTQLVDLIRNCLRSSSAPSPQPIGDDASRRDRPTS